MRSTVQTIISALVLLLLYSMPLAAQNGKVSGTVKDANTGDPLPGANVFIGGDINKGAATNIEGDFIISGVPAGTHTLTASYIGYQKLSREITVESGETNSLEIEMSPQTFEGEEVVVSAQARGQTEAINQQVSSNNVVNVVSASKIRELPEANAAEALGRLPGVSLKRNAGEGNKVVVRGLSPEYNKIQIEGVTMAATGEEDRSVDLSMISPYMLQGIEISKTATADNEASHLGGIVNFKLKQAPDEPQMDFVAQGGYNQLRNEYGDYKFSLSGSNRFFDDKIGIFAQANIENRNRSGQTVDVGYDWYTQNAQNIDSGYVYTSNVNVSEVTRDVNRYGGVVVLDYSIPEFKVISSNFYSSKITDQTTLTDGYNPTASNRAHRYSFDKREIRLNSLTSKLRAEKIIGNFTVSADLSYSRSETEIPEILDTFAEYQNAFSSNWNPRDIQGGINPQNVTTELRESDITSDNNYHRFFQMHWDNSESLEENMSAKLDVNYQLDITDQVRADIKLGGQYKRKNKDYNYSSNKFEDFGEKARARSAFSTFFRRNYEDTPINYGGTYFPGEAFLEDRSDSEFLSGEYKINRMFDVDKADSFMRFAKDTLQQMHAQFGDFWFKDYHRDLQNDYWGHEDYYAGYVMSTIDIGEDLTIVPGVRYENNTTEYTARRGATDADPRDAYTQYDTTYTVTRENDFLLPMVQAKYKINDWLNVQASYTHTLSRPAYTQFIPKFISNPNASPPQNEYSNPYLKPAKSENIDLRFTVFHNKVGLFAIGGYRKSIENLIFYKELTLLGQETIDEYNLDLPEEALSTATGKRLDAYFNNPNETLVRGIEAEYQSNFWFLPGVLSGLVFNINYTRAFSEADYPWGLPDWEQEIRETPFGADTIQVVGGTIDTNYSSRMIDQPNHILNISLGFDYKGFSIRGSMQYKSDIFISTDFHADLREKSRALTIWDLSVKQQLPVDGLHVFGNLKNITAPVESNTNSTQYYTNKHYYGMTGDIGVRYTF